MADERIIGYFKEGRKKGFSDFSLRSKLVQDGVSEKEIDNAVSFIGKEENIEGWHFRIKLLEGLKEHSPIFLRISMGLMYLWFGIQQFINPELFFGFIPKYANAFPLSTLMTVYLNGAFEILFASILLLGIFVRSSALILSLHLYVISFSLDYGGIMVRDIALATALFVIFLHGSDKWCLDNLLEKFKKRKR